MKRQCNHTIDLQAEGRRTSIQHCRVSVTLVPALTPDKGEGFVGGTGGARRGATTTCRQHLSDEEFEGPVCLGGWGMVEGVGAGGGG